MNAYQPKTGQACGCKRGVMRDNCPQCEGTGMRIDFAAIRARALSNSNCDGSGPCMAGETRWLPTGGDSNLILCRNCFNHELQYRRKRNRTLSNDFQFKLPTWDECKVNQ